MRVLRDVRRGQAHRALPFFSAGVLGRPHGSIGADALHDPGLPVRDAQVAVVVPRLDHVAPADGQVVAASCRVGVVHHTETHPGVADAGVEFACLVIRCHGDGVTIVPVACDRLLCVLGGGVQHDQAERV